MLSTRPMALRRRQYRRENALMVSGVILAIIILSTLAGM
jgi:hypothetical protein